MGHDLDEEKDDRGTVCVKYLLFLFNFFFWIGGVAVIGMGLWTLLEKSSYIAFLANSTLSVSAYILLFAGGVVMITGFLGCCSLIREHKTCLSIVCWGIRTKERQTAKIAATYGAQQTLLTKMGQSGGRRIETKKGGEKSPTFRTSDFDADMNPAL